MTATTLCDPLQALPEHESWLRSALHARLGSRDEVEEAWRFIDSIRAAWEDGSGGPLATYPAGTWGPAQADTLIHTAEAQWRRL